MEYVKGNPFFCLDTDRLKSYPYLNKNTNTEILIIGGGIDGAIANYYLSSSYDVMLVDKSRIGMSCTSCATALLEYQLDDFASELEDVLSEQEIIDIYKMGLYSIDKIAKFIKKNGNKCHFSRRPSFLYGTTNSQAKKIQKEYDFRIKYDFDCMFFDATTNPFPFDIKGGLYCENGGCELDPYLFTKQLIENSNNQSRIFENTEISRLEKTEDGYLAYTSFGEKINCKKVIIATGFNWEFLDKDSLCSRFVSYTITTRPIKSFSWYEKALIQDCEDPYHYLRMLPNNRIIFGGEDTTFNDNNIDETLAEKKYASLLTKLKELFPEIVDKIEVERQFCGMFGATKNNMGLIGKTKDLGILYFFSCGANGIINAMYGIELIEDILENRTNKLEKVFSPVRAQKK